MCRRIEEEVGPTVGLPRHRHFVGFFNVPVQAPTRGQPFYTVILRNRPIYFAFTIMLGIRRTNSQLNPPGPHGGVKNWCNVLFVQDLYTSCTWKLWFSYDICLTRSESEIFTPSIFIILSVKIVRLSPFLSASHFQSQLCGYDRILLAETCLLFL